MNFFKKPPQKKTLLIPYEHTEEIARLADDSDKKPNWLASYRLWKRVEEIYPEICCSNWKIQQRGSKIFIITI